MATLATKFLACGAVLAMTVGCSDKKAEEEAAAEIARLQALAEQHAEQGRQAQEQAAQQQAAAANAQELGAALQQLGQAGQAAAAQAVNQANDALAQLAGALGQAGGAAAAGATTCGTTAQTLAGPTGTTFTVSCPAGCGSSTAWGTDIYSDDSSVCTAAIHAGAIQAATGGTITVTIADGLSEYPSSARNGITTSRWGSWGRSFTVAAATGPQTIECGTNAQGMAGATGTVITVACPAGCGARTAWGTDVYSDDSSVCTAAIHAGVIQAAAGGPVVVTIADGQPSYPASARNGVSTSQWGSWGRSFTVAAP